MGRTRVRRREQERPEGSPLARLKVDAERSRDVEPVAGEVLRLQRSGGNEAVGTMLAQREAATAQDSDSGKDGAATSTLVFDDPIGVIPLISLSRSANGEVTVTLPSTAQDPVLMDACANGREIGTVKVSMRGYTLTLKNVVISSCQAGGGGGDSPTLRLSLNSDTAAPEQPPDHAPDQRPGRRARRGE